jgi:uncharacterized protein involved in outer membrane biogenesis
VSVRGKIWSGIVFTLVLIIGVVIATWDWNWFKPMIERQASTATGLDVRIDGSLGVNWSWTPEFDIPAITVANPDWKGPENEKQLAKIDDLLIGIDLEKLLGGKLALTKIIITRPDLTLRKVSASEENWAVAKKEDKPAKRSSIPEIGLLQIKDGVLDYKDAVKNIDMKGTISTVEGDANQEVGANKVGFKLTGKGKIQQDPLEIKAEGGPLMNLGSTSKPYPISIDITVEKTRLQLNGSIVDPVKLTGVDASLELQGPSAGDLFPLLNVPAPETPPYHIKGHLRHEGDVWIYENFDGTVGSSDLGGSLSVDTSQPKLFIKGELDSKKLDFVDIGPLIGIPPESKAATDEQRKEAANYHASTHVLPDAKLELGKVRSVNADVEWKVASVLAPGLPLDKVDLHVKLQDGILDLDPLDIGVAGGRVNSRIRIDARQDQVVTDYDIRLSSFQLAQFLDKAGLQGKGQGSIGGRIQLHAPGNSVRESLGNSNGTVGVVMSKGSISDLALALIGIDIGDALRIELTQDKLIPIRCVAASFDVNDGLMKPQVFVIDTDSTLVKGSGDINLKDEALNLQLTASQKSPTLLAAPTPIDIDGTFKHPEFGLDTKVLIERGAAAVALGALLTPVGSLLAFIDPGLAKDSDCAKELATVKDAPEEHPASEVAPSRK